MKTTTLLSLAVVASAFSHSSFAAPDLHRVARTEETERTGHQVQQALARYSQPSIAEIGSEAFEGTGAKVGAGAGADQDGQQQPEQRKGPQSAFRAEVSSTKEMSPMDKKTDKEYDVYEDNDDGGHDDDDELEDEDDKKGQKVGDSDKKEKEKDVLSVMQLAQFDPASSRRPKAIDSERIPIEYNPSEVAFVGQVGIGTPNQYFNLEFDIGSSDTWVTSARANCSQDSPCSTTARRGFHIERSSTFVSAPNISWHLELSDGLVVKGTLGTDVVQVAGFVVDRQVIGVADSLKGVKENGIDGSFGLGLKDLTFNGDSTPVHNLINANAMRSEVGVWLGSGNQGGELTFGGQDRARYFSGLYTVSCDLSKIDIWFDLGPQATAAAGPAPALDTVVSSQDGASETTPTSSTATNNEDTPQFSAQSSASFTKGNITTTGEWTSTNKFRVRGQDLVRERVPVIGGVFNLCFSGIQASKNDEDDWVFGNIWFMNNYMTLDHRRRLTGIAPAVQS
ncbi:MAG: aspartic peptidase domain-containing protein [Linnemannia elongata]|nr:MAG: aspartic peptidase domain-containing protein [Linnemannia elongata]